MKVLILGGTGFIAKRLISMLSDVEIISVSRTLPSVQQPNCKYVLADRSDTESLVKISSDFSPDVVLDMIPKNESDMRLVLQGIRGCVNRIVIVSSGSVYRNFGILLRSEEGPIDNKPASEDSPIRSSFFPYRHFVPPGHWLYDFDKILAETEVLKEKDMLATVVRLPLVYGPGDRDHRIGQYLRAMRQGSGTIALTSSMAAWRNSRAYVDNVAHGLALVVRSTSAKGIYNISESESLREDEWILQIAACAKWKGGVQVVENHNEGVLPPISELPRTARYEQHLIIDSSRIRSQLGFTEIVSASCGLSTSISALEHDMAS